MEGIFNGINGNLIQIDTKFYKYDKPQFAPKKVGVMVSFSTSKTDPTVLTFIKAKDAPQAAQAAPVATSTPVAAPVAQNTATSEAPAVSKPTYQKKYTGSYGAKSGSFNTKKDLSIIRQVIFKAASEQVAAGKGASIDEVYAILKAKYEKELLAD